MNGWRSKKAGPRQLASTRYNFRDGRGSVHTAHYLADGEPLCAKQLAPFLCEWIPLLSFDRKCGRCRTILRRRELKTKTMIDVAIAPDHPEISERLAEVLVRVFKAPFAGRTLQRNIRPVFCPSCRRHFSTLVLGGHPGQPTVVHYLCAACGGDGTPANREVPR